MNKTLPPSLYTPMNDYIALRIDASPCSEDITDLMAAFLADLGYDSFLPDNTGLTAYIPEPQFDMDAAREALADFPMPTEMTFAHQRIEGKDWNSEWEKNYFKPIVVGDRCLIHSSFHTGLPHAKYDITIDPKMAFGTGHHSTTSLMIGFLLDMDLTGKTVTDMGTGTGILAILCCMAGAKEVQGIEIDNGAYLNAIDNAALNNAEIRLVCGDASSLADIVKADVFIANINRNIIIADIRAYAAAMNPGATLLLGGFYLRDIPMIERAAAPLGLTLQETRSDNDWAAIRLSL